MKRIEKLVPVVEFETTDGKIFKEEHVAKLHQDILDGTKKSCEECFGEGTISVDEGEWGYYEKWVKRPCKNCKGRGYLELKWA